ncbi:MAG TPA: tRNA threonylcarbamoyladenosine dehydratase [Saprospiraceae bacterium]|nr:tRNA threonylcarbamoyladenosine dehydratase [Saprospiraceae bacterium]
MTFPWLERTTLLIGDEATLHLSKARILLVGLGGVGSFAGEFLVRAGIGHLTMVDGDKVDRTNINRQLQALHSTIGMGKARLLEERFRDIHPGLDLLAVDHFMTPGDMQNLLESGQYDFVLDCIDSFQPKLTLLELAYKSGLRVVSSMGAGGKTDPSRMAVADLFDTHDCRFAQKVRKQMRHRGAGRGITAIYSDELQHKEALKYTDGTNYKRSYYGTISYMPALFGLWVASTVIREITSMQNYKSLKINKKFPKSKR